MSRSPGERLIDARAAVDRACHLLLTPNPQHLDDCAALLQAAIAEVKPLRTTGKPAADCPGAFAEACLLQASIGRAWKMLESAAAFHANWVRYLGMLCSGYTVEGEPAAVDRGSRLLARG